MFTQTKRKERLSVTVNSELKALAKELANVYNTTPSGFISQCIEEFVKKHKEKLMIEFYQEMAKDDDRFAKESVNVIQNIASSWSD